MPTLHVEDFSIAEQQAIVHWLERNGEGGLISSAHPIRVRGPVALYWRIPRPVPAWRVRKGRALWFPVLRVVKGWWS